MNHSILTLRRLVQFPNYCWLGDMVWQGKFIAKTRGCILVGNEYGHTPSNVGVFGSKRTLAMLRETLPLEFILHITELT